MHKIGPKIYELLAQTSSCSLTVMELLQSACTIAASGLIPSRPGYAYDHLRGQISVCGGWGCTLVIVLSLLQVLDAGTVSLLLFVWMTQWTRFKSSLKLTYLLRLTQYSCL